MNSSSSAATTHQLIVNDQEQFAVWPTTHRLPAGWRAVGRTGSRETLAAYLREVLVETLPAPLLRSDGKPDTTPD